MVVQKGRRVLAPEARRGRVGKAPQDNILIIFAGYPFSSTVTQGPVQDFEFGNCNCSNFATFPFNLAFLNCPCVLPVGKVTTK